MQTHDDILSALRGVPDPEMPISIVDLGLVERISVDGARVEVELVPTFVGCPALDMIEGDVRAKIAALDGVESIAITWIYDPPWTVDRITDAGRESLREHGVTVPAPSAPGSVEIRTSAVPCPFCGSTRTRLDSPFGPTRCRRIHYCEACRNAFEGMKRVGAAEQPMVGPPPATERPQRLP